MVSLTLTITSTSTNNGSVYYPLSFTSPTARIHSLESFGTHEGPGIRYVLFMQGCHARCRYCQNPDTWNPGEGRAVSAAEIFEKIMSCLPYFQASGGGVTASGGEPMLQPDFLTALFTLCRAQGIHTALDTSGFIAPRRLANLTELIALTDLFLLDLKCADPAIHQQLTGRDLAEPLALLNQLEKLGKHYWIRQVLVPGLNDGEHELRALKILLAPLKTCEKFEFIPYHTLGAHKWTELGIACPLASHRHATDDDVTRAMKLIKGQ